jgi:hypothetical protein
MIYARANPDIKEKKGALTLQNWSRYVTNIIPDFINGKINIPACLIVLVGINVTYVM